MASMGIIALCYSKKIKFKEKGYVSYNLLKKKEYIGKATKAVRILT